MCRPSSLLTLIILDLLYRDVKPANVIVSEDGKKYLHLLSKMFQALIICPRSVSNCAILDWRFGARGRRLTPARVYHLKPSATRSRSSLILILVQCSRCLIVCWSQVEPCKAAGSPGYMAPELLQVSCDTSRIVFHRKFGLPETTNESM